MYHSYITTGIGYDHRGYDATDHYLALLLRYTQKPNKDSKLEECNVNSLIQAILCSFLLVKKTEPPESIYLYFFAEFKVLFFLQLS